MSRSRKITAGVDIGSTTSKAVMLIDGQVASFVIGPITVNPIKTARQVYLEALNGAGVYHNQVSYIAGTGYGGANVDFAMKSYLRFLVMPGAPTTCFQKREPLSISEEGTQRPSV